MTHRILSQSSFSHIVDVPIERIDIADWLFNLPEAEYKRCCPPDHIAAGATSTDDGRRMSINVEMIGETLMIQQYVGEITEPHLCRMVSLSDAFTPNGRTKVNVLWELSVKPISSTRCEYTNSVAATPTEEFLDFIKRHGISFEQAAAARQAAGGDHNRRETPLFAESIARRALARSPFEGSLGSRRSPPSDRSRSLDTAEAFTVDIKFVKAEKPLWMSASRLTIVRRTHGFLLNMTRHDSRVAKHSGQNKGAAAAGNGQRPMERNPT